LRSLPNDTEEWGHAQQLPFFRVCPVFWVTLGTLTRTLFAFTIPL
jgi:hypothetical protein